jgi:hypothetical protein
MGFASGEGSSYSIGVSVPREGRRSRQPNDLNLFMCGEADVTPEDGIMSFP